MSEKLFLIGIIISGVAVALFLPISLGFFLGLFGPKPLGIIALWFIAGQGLMFAALATTKFGDWEP